MGSTLFALATSLAVVSGLPTDEAPKARQYFDWFEKSLAAIQTDIPAITRAAQAAVDPLLAKQQISVRGDNALAYELSDRTGGFIFAFALPAMPVRDGDVILYAMGVTARDGDDAETLLKRQLQEAAALRAGGSVVIAIASKAQLEAHNLWSRAQRACTHVLDNHGPARDGLLRDKAGKAIVPTFTTTNAAVAWTWCAELFAACTRRGKTLAVRPDMDGPRQKLTFDRNWTTRFHKQTIDPIAAGVLGRSYLKRLRAIARDVGTASWPQLVQTAWRASDTAIEGDKVFLRVGGPYVAYHHGGQLAADPDIFERLDHDGSNWLDDRPGDGDFVIAIGQSAPPGTEWWGQPEMLREAGRGVSWIVSAYLTHKHDLHRGEIVVDQRWPEGDALVRAAGYDVRLCPASSVIGEAILWTITAEAHDLIERHRSTTHKIR